MLRIAESHVGPGLPRIGALVDAVAVADAAVGDVFSRAEPHHVRIAGVDRHVAQRVGAALVKDRLPVVSTVGRLPQSARSVREIPGASVRGIDGDLRHATWLERRPEQPERRIAREVLDEALDKGLSRHGGRRRNRLHIQQEDASPVRRDYELVLEGVNGEIVHGGGRQGRAERLPGAAAVRRDVNAQVGSHIENLRAAGVFSDDVHRFRWQIARDRRPGRSVVHRSVDIAREVVLAVAGQRDVHGSEFVTRCLDAAHPLPWQTVMTGRPRASVVTRRVGLAVVQSDVDHAPPQA